MSKDKHKALTLRKYALANIGKLSDWALRCGIMIVADTPEPSPKKGAPSRVTVDVTKAVRQLEKRGLVKRERCVTYVGGRNSRHNITAFRDASV